MQTGCSGFYSYFLSNLGNKLAYWIFYHCMHSMLEWYGSCSKFQLRGPQSATDS